MAQKVSVGRRNATLTFILLAFTLGLFSITCHENYQKVGQPFPGFLAFENNIVGPFYVPGWTDSRKGILYHDRQTGDTPSPEIFSKQDYTLVVLLPSLSGLLFAFLGAIIFIYMPITTSRLPLLIFHFLAGNYLILSPDFHLTYNYSYLLLCFFSFIPATILHFALFFPETSNIIIKHSRAFLAPYVISTFLCIPYLYYFKNNPAVWILFEYATVLYVVAAYLFWLVRLIITLKRPQLEINRIIARYLLLGQLIAFTVPLAAAIAIFVTNTPVPLNLAAPIILLFPVSLFLGVIMGRLRQSQIQLIMMEKRAAVGNLMAGLAHELNNPMTFIYSNLEPFKEITDDLKQSVKKTQDDQSKAMIENLDELRRDIDAGATRAKAILDNFREFSHPGQSKLQEIDINQILDQSLKLLSPKWRDRISIVRQYGNIPLVQGVPEELGQVFINIIANSCDAIKDRGTIELLTERNGSGIRIRIRDTGCGIPKAVLPRIFDPFVTLKSPGKGTGLGLALSLETLKRHHGSIEVSSEAGKGTEFDITLPGVSL